MVFVGRNTLFEFYLIYYYKLILSVVFYATKIKLKVKNISGLKTNILLYV